MHLGRTPARQCTLAIPNHFLLNRPRTLSRLLHNNPLDTSSVHKLMQLGQLPQPPSRQHSWPVPAHAWGLLLELLLALVLLGLALHLLTLLINSLSSLLDSATCGRDSSTMSTEYHAMRGGRCHGRQASTRSASHCQHQTPMMAQQQTPAVVLGSNMLA